MFHKFRFINNNDDDECCGNGFGGNGFGAGGRMGEGCGHGGGFGKRGGGRHFMKKLGEMGAMHRMGKMKGKLLSSDEMHLIVLHLMQEKPIYGYEVMKAVEQLTSGVYTPSPGMIYPLLNYITELNQADIEVEGKRKKFTITPDGNAFLEENSENLSIILERIKLYGERLHDMKSRMEEEESAEDAWGREHGGAQNFDMRREFHEIRHNLRKAMFKKRLASPEERKRVIGILQKAIEDINQTNQTSNEGE